MSVNDAVTSYKQLPDSTVGFLRFRRNGSPMGFKKEALMQLNERILKALRSDLTNPDELGKEFQSGSGRCKTIICSIQSGQDQRHKKLKYHHSIPTTKSSNVASCGSDRRG